MIEVEIKVVIESRLGVEIDVGVQAEFWCDVDMEILNIKHSTFNFNFNFNFSLNFFFIFFLSL